MRLLFYFALILSLYGLLVECASVGFFKESIDSYRYGDFALTRHKRQTPNEKTKSKTSNSNKKNEKVIQQSNEKELTPPLPPVRQSAAIQRPLRGEYRPVLVRDSNGNNRLALAYFPPTSTSDSELGGQRSNRPVMLINLNSSPQSRPQRRRPAQPLFPFGMWPFAFAFAAARN